MMTCRLLCALLVLALCCCPSVCVAGTNPDVKASVAASPKSPPSVTLTQGKSEPGSLGNGSVADLGSTAVDGPALTAAGRESGDVSNTLQNQGPDGTPGPEISTGQSAEEANQEAEDPAETTATTTTTQAPTTITTTTTKAPSNTAMNTEALTTTTTTRAPSRLREIDGSLSSSAWVCAPLLLAVSALAYTTLC
ncbi:putative mucin TcMUCII [Trypanosoma cruzi]|uniref:Mucin TcMUCII, putative n=2 Tax=Trypanosoma cruzi TaxID=5693 RepID=Q4DF32_TRYCC|nr:mucin TcMUCII, putative [Trypanosoma cruzi]EAN91136.1 mucin TcMUCII, putative [Trypanosoma cruzi]PWV10641.1 putative mucin TcMUCII [Trypanosoma cruzi]RNC56399.1 mucin TcMUCII [Trypanosoma cruzi]|eukprot:XP_812987.1 mucin TcMUCII [Trypanosoma cruzi strain CL Brener]